MDIKNKLFKFKRAIHRNRELIARVCTITFVVCLLAAVAWGSYEIVQSDRREAAKANQVVPEGEVIEASKRAPKETKTFTLAADKDGMQLYYNESNGEIKVVDQYGVEWFSNPVDYSKAEKPKKKTLLRAQFYVNFVDAENSLPVSGDWTSYEHSFRLGGMEKPIILKDDKGEAYGVKIVFKFPIANVIIPVQYCIVDGAFQAEVLTDEIQRVNAKSYHITDIKLLPYFGAANQSTDGELLVPDGSGALIDFNNGKNNDDIIFYNNRIYGKNINLSQTAAESVKEQISLPIFGSKWEGKDGNADSGFLGVIVSGEASSSIVASTSGKISSYNMIYATANMIDHTYKKTDGSVYAGKTTHIMATSDNLINNQNFAVRYYFLNGDDANYVGMAEKYREHLQKADQLKDKTALADKKYLVLDLIGAVSIEKYVFGVQKPVVTALTTYNDVVTIVKELKAEGIDNLVINYIGALDGGLNNKMYSCVETESVLGTGNEFRAMIDYLNQEGVIFFLESNPIDIYNNGNGYDNNADAAKTFFDKYAFQYKYILDSEQYDKNSRWHILHPAKVPGFVDQFATSATEWGLKNISLDRIGKVLYTDYADDVENTTRADALEYWNTALKTADEKSENLMVHSGNAYAMAYADIVTDVANGSSDYDMADQTVPFYQIVFQGNTVLAPTAFNMSVDYERELLKILENGGNLKYNLIYGDVDQLVGTEFDTMVSYSYKRWKSKVVEHYKVMQEVSAQFAGKNIIAHEIIADDVTVTEYENGKVIVNCSDDAYTYEGDTIPSKQYKVILGGAK